MSQTVIVSRSRRVTLKQLCEKRARLNQQAREHALASALEYYETSAEQLKEVVFRNWLESLAFREDFKPMNLAG